MQAEQYTDKSFAVFGDTKPWSNNLKGLGGKFNGNLRGRPGWIFTNAKQAEVMQFLGQVQAGQIQPTPQASYQVAQPQLAPFGATQPAMTPQTALNRLQIAQPTIPFPQPTPQIAFPSIAVPFPQIQPLVGTVPVNVPKPVSPVVPKPVTMLPAQATTVNYPNLFTAADGLQYQIVMYTVPLPSVGQRVTLTVGENVVEYVVSNIESVTPPFDSILIAPVNNEQDQEQQMSRAVLAKGKWQICGLQDDHTITFHPLA